MMKIAVCSDIHDNLTALDNALAVMKDKDADILIFCGDFCAPFTLKAIAEGFDGPVHVVWGNNDGDQWLLTEIAHKAENVTLHGVFAELDLDGYSVAAIHYPSIAQALARSDLYKLVCYGHDHTAHQELVGETLLLNPGEMMGRFGHATFAIVNTETEEAEIHEVLSR